MSIKLYSKNYDGNFLDASSAEGIFSTYHNVVTYESKFNIGFLKGDGEEYENISLSFEGKKYRLQYTIDSSQNYIDLNTTDGLGPSSLLKIDEEILLVNSVNPSTKRLVVTRGYNSTVAISHQSSSEVTVSILNTNFSLDGNYKTSLNLFLDPIELNEDIDDTVTQFTIKDTFDCLAGTSFSNGVEKFKILEKESLNDNLYLVTVERENAEPHLKGEIFYISTLIDDRYHQFIYYTSPIKGSGESERNDILLSLNYFQGEENFNRKYEIKTYIRLAVIGTIGDSITAGHAAFRAEDHKGTYCCNGVSYDNDNTSEDVTSQYQYWLSYRLGKNYKIYNYGTGEEVGYQVGNRFIKEILSLHPDYVIIQCGTNDLSLFNGASVVSGIEQDSTMDKWIFTENPIILSKNNSQITYYGLVPAVKEMIQLSLDNKIKVIVGNLLPRNGLTSDMKGAFKAYNDWLLSYVDQFEDVYMVDFFNASNEGDYLREDPEDETNYNMNDYFSSGAEFNEDGTIKKSGDGIHLNSTGYKIMGYCMNIDILFNATVEGFELYNTPDLLHPPIEGVLDSSSNIYIYPIKYNLMQIHKEKIVTKYLYNKGSNNELFYIYISEKDGCEVYFIKDNKRIESFSGQLAAGSFLQLPISVKPLRNNAKIQIRLIGRPLEVI